MSTARNLTQNPGMIAVQNFLFLNLAWRPPRKKQAPASAGACNACKIYNSALAELRSAAGGDAAFGSAPGLWRFARRLRGNRETCQKAARQKEQAPTEVSACKRDLLALAELRSAAGGLQAVLKQYFCLFPSVFKAFREVSSCFPLRVNPSKMLEFPRFAGIGVEVFLISSALCAKTSDQNCCMFIVSPYRKLALRPTMCEIIQIHYGYKSVQPCQQEQVLCTSLLMIEDGFRPFYM